MRVLLTFTGFHDPFSVGAAKGDKQAGPVLTVVAERGYERVYLFTTPRLQEVSNTTARAIRERHPDTKVEILDVPLKDPTNYLGIIRQLRILFKKLHRNHPDASYAISVASGTPQMHACWLLLAASGEIPAVILQSHPPEFVPAGKSLVKEIDLHKQGFPNISTAAPTRDGGEEDGDLIEICRELGIVGEDPSFWKMLEQAKVYAEYDDIHSLLLGETGSGKEYLARFIHRTGPRANRPLVTVNCSSIPKEMVESQLFGHKKGAFTGATYDSPGKFKAADGGVLFLDEIGELPIEAQAKILRALDQGEIEPLGCAKPQTLDVRVIAATNRNIREMVAKGTFRQDLYERFGATIRVPPLRERTVDIPKLALHILTGWNAKHSRERRLSAEALTALTRHNWPGNVRELHRVILQSAMLSGKKVIGPKDLQFEIPIASNPMATLPEPEEGFDLDGFLDEVKERLVQRALDKSGGVQARAARLLGFKNPQNLNNYLKRNRRQ